MFKKIIDLGKLRLVSILTAGIWRDYKVATLFPFWLYCSKQDFRFKELVNIIMHYHQGNHGIYEDGRPNYIECLGQVIPVSYGYYNEGYLKYHVHEFEKPLQQKLNQRLYAS
ncbi:hypothetical protein YC2023_031816 [Brassica napus]